MDVVGWIACGVRLSVNEFDQETVAANPVVMANARLGRTGPCKVDIFPTRFVDQATAFLG